MSPRLAFDIGAEMEHAITETFGHGLGVGERIDVAAENAVGHVARHHFRRLGDVAVRPSLQMDQHGCRRPLAEMVPVKDGEGLGERRRIGGSGAGRDDVERIADDIRDEEADHRLAGERLASRPPLMAPRCLRTAFISLMVAPQWWSSLVTASLASRETPVAGAGKRRAAAGKQAQGDVIRCRAAWPAAAFPANRRRPRPSENWHPPAERR